MSAGDVAPNEWECRVFVVYAELRTYAAAADALSAQLGRPYSDRAVAKVIRKIARWLPADAFAGTAQRKRLTPMGDAFLDSARSVVEDYRLMRDRLRIGGGAPGADAERDRAPVTGVPTVACLPHHVPFVSRAEVLLLNQAPAGRPKIAVDCLEHRHQADFVFRDHVVPRLKRGAVQMIIGPRVSDERSLISNPLFVAHLEVMLPRANSFDEIAPAQLIERCRLFLPPRGVDARRLFDEQIAELRDADATAYLAGECDDVATSVLRVRNLWQSSGPKLAVVAGSDVALAFKAGREFGGQHAQRFEWARLVPASGRRRLTEYRVCVTTRRTDAARYRPIVEALENAAAEFGLRGAAAR
jgi:DNA-binding transcriptional LysR family regulator